MGHDPAMHLLSSKQLAAADASAAALAGSLPAPRGCAGEPQQQQQRSSSSSRVAVRLQTVP
ncbi:hypothetical protein CHLRE_01g011050v5 [Chlamydomonas reinhardtii]|uniref:Uncharacterized protein n=1 Tax=Chlamydomonas reinhardtii TaxID=3055 RepID=A0A2K3E5F6_CHLRE|nr:uncharacterized protein CHLRE_01g011050v5 [Chlamydomonas reinhardtii]PNW88021.1 hypothetical protein CHLRE_01g011050v5 [Chlamydomonas reinhardtii]